MHERTLVCLSSGFNWQLERLVLITASEWRIFGNGRVEGVEDGRCKAIDRNVCPTLREQKGGKQRISGRPAEVGEDRELG
jgi:hypothetical protein